MPAKPAIVSDVLFTSFEQINYLEVVNELILFKGNEVVQDGIFNVYELTREAFIFYRLKFDKTNFHNLITRLHRQLRSNGELIECENPKGMPAKLLELCAFYNGKYYDKVKLYDGYEQAIETNNYYKSRKQAAQPFEEAIILPAKSDQQKLF